MEDIIKPKKQIKKVLEINQTRKVYECLIKKKHTYWDEIDNLTFLSKNLYNQATYLLRKKDEDDYQKFLAFKADGGEKPKTEQLSFFQLDPILKNNFEFPDYRQLPAQTSQQILKKIDEIWKSYNKSKFDYYKNPSKYKGRPQAPNFKHKTDGRFMVVYTNQGISQKLLKNGIIKLSKTNIEIPFNIKDVQITEVRLIPMTNQQYKIEVVYIQTCEHKNLMENNHLYIDMGIDNIVTCLDNLGNSPFTISGKLIKSVNRKYNDDVARLTSILQLREPNRKNTRQIMTVRNNRNNKIKSLFHKISKNIVDYCVENKIKSIIVGKNDGWKEQIGTKSTKENNFKFNLIPYQILLNQLTYKMNNIGGECIQIEEAYTSKCDHLVLEPMCHQEKYLGIRNSKKATFKSSTGIILHDDVNGCIGIARKFISSKIKQQKLIDMVINKKSFYPKKININL